MKRLVTYVAARLFIAALTVIGVASIHSAQAQAQATASATTLAFEVASIKATAEGSSDVGGYGQVVALPGGRLSADRVQLRRIIEVAYSIRNFQLIGGPDWINSAHYTIEAKAESNVSIQQTWLMLQALLSDRFKLKVHRETREMPVYELQIAKGGLKIEAPKGGTCTQLPEPSSVGVQPPPPTLMPGEGLCGRVIGTGAGPDGELTELIGRNVTVASFIRTLASTLGPVIDKTNLQGTFDIRMQFDSHLGDAIGESPSSGLDTRLKGPSLFTAIEEQLGLRLVAAKGPVEVIVIDHVEKPSEGRLKR